MKKEYIKPEVMVEEILLESMLASSPGDGMSGNETPGGDDDFNSNDRRGTWGNLWD